MEDCKERRGNLRIFQGRFFGISCGILCTGFPLLYFAAKNGHQPQANVLNPAHSKSAVHLFCFHPFSHTTSKYFLQLSFQQPAVNRQIFIRKNIKNHLANGTVCFQKVPHFLHRKLCCFLLRKMKNACGNAAEGNGLHSVFCRQLQA